MRYLQLLQAIIAILPTLVQLIDQIENLFPEGGKGAMKLEILKNALKDSYVAANEFANFNFDELWSKIQGVIASIVNIRKTATNK